MVYFSSDFHLGHKNILKQRTQFKTIEEHDEAIFTELNKLSHKDILFIVGDFLFESEKYNYYIQRIKEVKCKIKLIMGNHDDRKLYNEKLDNLEIQLPLFSYKNIWISHCPIHTQEIRNRYGNIHGHLHSSVVEQEVSSLVYNDFDDQEIEYDNVTDERYFNVNLDNNNFKFVSLDVIKKHFKI